MMPPPAIPHWTADGPAGPTSMLMDSDGYQGPSWLDTNGSNDAENDDDAQSDGSTAPLHKQSEEDRRPGDGSASTRGQPNAVVRCIKSVKEWRQRRKAWPKRCAGHRMFVVLNVFTVGSCFRMLSSQIMPLAFLDLSLLQVVLRIYMTIYCVIFIIAELELPVPFLKASRGLRTFASRGFLLTFVATIGVVQGDTDEGEDALHRASSGSEGSMPGAGFFIALVIQLSSWMMMIVGLIYILLGSFCMQRVRDRYREEYGRRVEKYLRELDDPQSKKEVQKFSFEVEE